MRRVSELKMSECRDTQREESHDATMTYTPAWLRASPGSGPHGCGTVQNEKLQCRMIHGSQYSIVMRGTGKGGEAGRGDGEEVVAGIGQLVCGGASSPHHPPAVPTREEGDPGMLL